MMAAEHSVTSTKKARGRGKGKKTLALLDAAIEFLVDANPTTVRGVCYGLFVRGIIPSMSRNETARVSRILTNAREDGTIPWEWIVDETRDLERSASWTDPDEYLDVMRRSYRRDFWIHQPANVEVWSEKGTIRGVLAPVLREYGVGFRVLHGFGSSTAVYDVANTGKNRPLIALYVGDHDPSGRYMSDHDLPERLQRYGGHHVDVRRIALTEFDIIDPDLPSFPASDKRQDPRYRWFVQNHGARCWELDAMHPNTIRERVRECIEAQIEIDAWARCELAQEAEQESLEALLDRWVA